VATGGGRHLRIRLEFGLGLGQVCGKVGREIGGVQVEQAIRGLDRRMNRVGECLAVAHFRFARIQRMRGDI
jgi:hypothetical protein